MTPVIQFSRPASHAPQPDACCGRWVMRPTVFDLVTSFFSALMIMLATLVMILFLLWLLAGSEPEPASTPRLSLSSGGASLGEQIEFEIPEAAEVTDLASSDLVSVLAGVESVTQQVAAAMGSGDSGGSGTGTDKSAGPDVGDDLLGEGQRWELTFRAADRQDYAKQLDFHGIELAAVGGGRQGIDYASQIGSGSIVRHLEDASVEERLYFSWLRPSPLAGYERQLLAAAGITVAGRQILKFIPAELEIRLAEIELEYAQTHGVSTLQGVAKTVFRSEGAGAQYRFAVVSQRYKRGWSSVVSGEPKN